MIFIIFQQNFKWFSNVWVSKLLTLSLSWGEPHRPSDGGWGGAGCPRCPRCWKCRWWLSPGAKWGEALASWDCWWISDRDPWANSIHWYLKQIANESVGPRISEICRNGTLQRRWIPCRHFVCTSAKTGVGVPDVYRFHTWLQTFDDRGTPGPRGPRMPRYFLTQLETRDLQGSEDSWSGLAKFSCLSMLHASFKDQLSSWVCSKMHHIIIELQKKYYIIICIIIYYYILIHTVSYLFKFQVKSRLCWLSECMDEVEIHEQWHPSGCKESQLLVWFCGWLSSFYGSNPHTSAWFIFFVAESFRKHSAFWVKYT